MYKRDERLLVGDDLLDPVRERDTLLERGRLIVFLDQSVELGDVGVRDVVRVRLVRFVGVVRLPGRRREIAAERHQNDLVFLLLQLPAPGRGIEQLRIQLDAGLAGFFADDDEPRRVLVRAVADRHRQPLAVLHADGVGAALRPARGVEVLIGLGEVERQRFDAGVRVAPVQALPCAVQPQSSRRGIPW